MRILNHARRNCRKGVEVKVEKISNRQVIRWRCGEAPIGRKEGFEVANGRTRAEHADEWDAAGLVHRERAGAFGSKASWASTAR